MRKYREELAEENRRLEEEAEVEEVVVDEYECAACKKTFKKQGQLQNHLQSKKHKDTIKHLRHELGVDIDEVEVE